MGKKSRLKAERGAQAAASGAEAAAPSLPPLSAVTGPVRLVVGFVALGLVTMFLWSFAYRIQHPSLTQVSRHRQAPPQDQAEMPGQGEESPMAMITALMQRLKDNPDDVDTLSILGEQFMRMEQWDRAAQLLNRALTVEPTNVGVLNLLGILDFNQEKYKESAEKFEMIAELDPANMMARYNLGVLYGHFLDDKAKAAGHMRAVAESPDVDEETRAQAREELKSLEQ